MGVLEATLLQEVGLRGGELGGGIYPFLACREFQACLNTCKYVPVLPTPTLAHLSEGHYQAPRHTKEFVVCKLEPWLFSSF